MPRAVSASLWRVLCERGIRVVINDLSLKAAEAAAESLTKCGFEAAAIAADISCTSDVQRLFEQTIERFGSLWLLVNNAGVYR